MCVCVCVCVCTSFLHALKSSTVKCACMHACIHTKELENFLKRVEPSVCAQLKRNLESHAYDGTNSKRPLFPSPSDLH